MVLTCGTGQERAIRRGQKRRSLSGWPTGGKSVAIVKLVKEREVWDVHGIWRRGKIGKRRGGSIEVLNIGEYVQYHGSEQADAKRTSLINLDFMVQSPGPRRKAVPVSIGQGGGFRAGLRSVS